MKRNFYPTLFLSALILLTACNQKDQTNTESSPVKVKIMNLSSTQSETATQFSGTVEETNSTSLSFPVAGTIKKLYVDLGDQVRTGALIAELDPASMQSSYNAAKASLRQAEDAYNRMKELHDKGSLAEIKWIEIQSKLQQAQSVEELAKKNLKDCKLYAPFHGVIAEKSTDIGQNVLPGMSIGRLVSADKLKVKIAIPENEIANVYIGQKANITIYALDNLQINGTVSEKGVTANPLSRTYEVKIQINDPQKKVMPGMVAQVSLAQKDVQTTFVIPAHIVQTDENNQTFVWVNQNGKACKRTIECGEFTANGIHVISGLNDGDQIIIEGQQKVCNNTAIVF